MKGTEAVRKEAEDRVQKPDREGRARAEEAARARAEDRLRVESDRIRHEAEERGELARRAAEEEIRHASERARREALAAAAETAPSWSADSDPDSDPTPQAARTESNGAPPPASGPGSLPSARQRPAGGYRTF